MSASPGSTSRIFKSADWGESWTLLPTPIQAGNASSGIFSIAFRNPVNAMIVGGDYQEDERTGGNIAVSTGWRAGPDGRVARLVVR